MSDDMLAMKENSSVGRDLLPDLKFVSSVC
jgi:hypothetical protein